MIFILEYHVWSTTVKHYLREVCDDNLQNIITKSDIFWKHGVYEHNVINAI